MPTNTPPLYLEKCYQPFIITSGVPARYDGVRHPDKTIHLIRHKFYSVYCLLEGKLNWKDDTTSGDTNGPAALLRTPGQNTAIFAPAACEIIWMNFGIIPSESATPHDSIRERYDAINIQPDPLKVWGCELPFQIPHAFVAETYRTIREINVSWWRGPLMKKRADALVTSWLSLLLEQTDSFNELPSEFSTMTPIYNEEVKSALQVAENHLGQGITIKIWADLLHLTESQLYYLIRQGTELSPKQALEEIQIKTAKRLLQENRLSIELISKRTGFKSRPAFSRFFKRHLGLTPNEWKKGSRWHHAF